MSHAVKLALIGAGNRGQGIFGQYALDMPHRAQFTAVVEPDDAKRDFFALKHNIKKNMQFKSTAEFFANLPKGLNGVVIATLEDHRLDPILKSMEHDLNILVEKPLCTNKEDLIRLYDATKNYKKILIVCHQMRLTPIYKTIKALVDSGRFGKIVSVQHSENLSYSHMAHSFVRGVFNNDSLTPMLLAKSCHDMDILTHIIGRDVKKVSSFGSLNYFTKENCPKGAPKFCLDGCPHYATCPYNVLKLYFNNDTDQAYLRQMGVIKSKEQLYELLKKNRFGKCVFQTDNNVVDSQSVQIQFEGDINVSFMMCGHNGVERRITKISMTNGEIVHGQDGDLIRTYRFEPNVEEIVKVKSDGTHSGGDRAIMDNFVDAIVTGDHSILLTPIAKSLQGHLLVFGAEESRHSGKIIELKKFENEIRASLKKTSPAKKVAKKSAKK